MSQAEWQFDAAVLVGRYQPFLDSDLKALLHALELAQRVFVVIEASHEGRSPKTPWTWRERAECILSSVASSQRGRIEVMPVREYYDDTRLVEYVERRVEQSLLDAGAESLRITEVGPAVLHRRGRLKFGSWTTSAVPELEPVDGRSLLESYFAPDGKIETAELPSSSQQLLERFATTTHYAALAEEWRTLQDYRAAWQIAPYPPVFVTVDAVVACRGCVLLIRRKRAPGKGFLALPGGFIEQNETALQSALRELEEETQLSLASGGVAYSLLGSAVFDHPARSQRGRTISHAFHLDLGQAAMPEVRAADDAASVKWVSIERLSLLEEEFFDDHFHILEHFLKFPID